MPQNRKFIFLLEASSTDKTMDNDSFLIKITAEDSDQAMKIAKENLPECIIISNSSHSFIRKFVDLDVIVEPQPSRYTDRLIKDMIRKGLL